MCKRRFPATRPDAGAFALERDRRLARDRFLLYSVNQDGKDDGGDPKPAPTAVPSGSFVPHNARDFVWPDAAARLENEAP